jgi:hypothetical protein
MTSAISMNQRAAVMPIAAFMRVRSGELGPVFAITYQWDGGDCTGSNGLTAKHPTRPLGRLST